MGTSDYQEQQEQIFSMTGGHPALDFVNTVGGWREENGFDGEKLNSYADLVAWSRQAGVLTDAQAERLGAKAAQRPSKAKNALAEAVALREAIYKVFSAVANERVPRRESLNALNKAISDAMRRSRIIQTDEGFEWGWAGDEDALDQMLWPIARSAGELLIEGDLERVRQCAGDTCGWLFVDATRNHSRQWCDMRDCGNRAKAKRHYHRKRAMSTE